MVPIRIVPNLARKVNNLKIRNKIIVATALCIIFSSGFIGYFAYKISTGIIKRNAYKQTNETIQSSAKYMDEKIKNLLESINNMLINDTFKRSVIKVVVDENFNEGVEFSKIEPMLTQLRVTNRVIDSVYVVTPRMVFYDSTKAPIHRELLIEAPIYKRFLKNKLIAWGVAGEASWFKEKNGIIPIIIGISFGPDYASSIESANIFLVVHIKEYDMIQELSEIRNRFNAETFLLGPDGRMVTHSLNAKYQGFLGNRNIMKRLNRESQYFNSEINGEKVLFNYATLTVNGWKMVSVTPVGQLLEDIRYIELLTLIVGILCAGFSIYLSVIVSKTITNPLYKLQSVMRKVGNREFTARFEPKFDDEIGELAQNFNSMLDEINLLFGRLQTEQENFQTEQRLKQAAEIKALQSQINPHFLYNTLDSIYWKALGGGNEQVAEMVVSLSEFFRLGLNKGREEIGISQELRHVERYLFLQKSIYDSKFNYEITVDPAVNSYQILKFILQPLAENSLLHGFSEMKQGGIIRILAKKEAAHIRLEIHDNGKGFDVGTIQRALQDGTNRQGGYAFINIHQRLKLRYGEEYHFEMSSEPYRETVIGIWIPTVEES